MKDFKNSHVSIPEMRGGDGVLRIHELKAFVPAKCHQTSLQFYRKLGFEVLSNEGGVACLRCGDSSFLLQDYYEPTYASNTMMHLLVDNVQAWHRHLSSLGLEDEFGTDISKIEERPWAMFDLTLKDPSDVLWRIAENIKRVTS